MEDPTIGSPEPTSRQEHGLHSRRQWSRKARLVGLVATGSITILSFAFLALAISRFIPLYAACRSKLADENRLLAQFAERISAQGWKQVFVRTDKQWSSDCGNLLAGPDDAFFVKPESISSTPDGLRVIPTVWVQRQHWVGLSPLRGLPETRTWVDCQRNVSTSTSSPGAAGPDPSSFFLPSCQPRYRGRRDTESRVRQDLTHVNQNQLHPADIPGRIEAKRRMILGRLSFSSSLVMMPAELIAPNRPASQASATCRENPRGPMMAETRTLTSITARIITAALELAAPFALRPRTPTLARPGPNPHPDCARRSPSPA